MKEKKIQSKLNSQCMKMRICGEVEDRDSDRRRGTCMSSVALTQFIIKFLC